MVASLSVPSLEIPVSYLHPIHCMFPYPNISLLHLLHQHVSQIPVTLQKLQ